MRKPHMKRAVSDTRKVLAVRWDPKSLRVPAWVINAVIYITLARSFSYGIELLVLTSNPIGPLMAFAAILGLQTWGVLMLIGCALLLIGIIFRSSILVTLGVLLSAGVWTAFSLTMGMGFIETGNGGRHVVAALATAATWVVFFLVQLKSIRKTGGSV